MDRFRIEYRCRQEPKGTLGVHSFQTNQIYNGRAYNGLYEVSANWGGDAPSQLLSLTEFNKYFELVTEPAQA